MKIRSKLLAGPISTLLLLSIANSDRLQADVTGSILGTVRDPTGAIVAGATVKATNIGTNQARVTATDETGSYRVLALPVGRYTIEVTHPGFQKFLTTEI